MNTTSPTLLERLRQSKERAAWERFVRLYSPLLCRYAQQLSIQDSDVHDLVQDVFTILVQKLPEFQYDRDRSFRGWLQVVVRNRWRENRRRRVAGDFNGDGALDLVAPNQATNDVSVLLNRTVASRRHLVFSEFFPCGKEPLAVAIADFNLDGIPDVAVANGADDTVGVFTGRGNVTYDAVVAYPREKRPRAVGVGDVNRDGRPDLVVVNQKDNTISVLLSRKRGGFDPAVSYSVGKSPVSIALIDLDRDGKLDVATADNENSSLSILRGIGDGTFQKAVSQVVEAHPFFVTSADLNGDGRNDLVVAHRDQVGRVSLLLGQGDCSFRAPVVLPAGSYPQSVAVADFNRDGRLDLAVGNWGLGDVNLFLGNGDGSFRNPVNFFIAGQAFAILAGDFDHDGKMDLAASAPGGGNNVVSVLRGNGDGTFEKDGSRPSVGLSPAGLAVADLDGDGWLDLIVANSESNSIGLLRNRPATTNFRVSTSDGGKVLLGSPIEIRVEVFTADNVLDKGYSGNLRFRGDDPGAVLPADYAFTSQDQGTKRFSATFKTPGVHTLTVEDTTGAVRAGTLTLGVLGPANLEFRVDGPVEIKAGEPFTVTVNVMEKGGRWISNFAGMGRFTSTDAAATLPPNYRFTGSQSVHTFTSGLTLRTPGMQTITVTDIAYPGLTGTVSVRVIPP